MDPIEYVGYLGMALIAAALIPQVARSWKTKSTKDISLVWNSVYFSGIMMWLVYGMGIGSTPLTLSSMLEGSLAASLLVLKIKYG
jgi:MtN3 and saliva related transmembrane protein